MRCGGLQTLLGVAALAFALGARADHHLFEFEQLYTNASGTVQFIVMHQTPPASGEDKWAGNTIDVIDENGAKTSYKFLTNLPSSSTSGRRVLIATQAFAALGIITPDYVVPNGFLPLSNGLLHFADFLFGYPALPTDGVLALDALTRTTMPNVATNFAGENASVTAAAPPAPPPPGAATVVRVIEYYNQSLDHYFITPMAGEIAALDAGTAIKGWVRTGEGFNVYLAAQAGTSPVCRYYIPPESGNSHFFGRGTAECVATGQHNPTFVLEDPSFMQVYLPAGGECAGGLMPVYRTFSNRADVNHRYMTSATIRDQMVAKGWVAEGDGPNLVVMCAVP